MLLISIGLKTNKKVVDYNPFVLKSIPNCLIKLLILILLYCCMPLFDIRLKKCVKKLLILAIL